MEPLYYTNAHNDYFKSISKRSKSHKDKERKLNNRSSITSFSLPPQLKESQDYGSGIQSSKSFKKYSNSSNVITSSNNSGYLSPTSATSPINITTSPSSKNPTVILIASQEYQARNKNEITVSAKEHLKLVSRKGNGYILVKAIGRLSGSGLLPISVVRIVDLDINSRQKFDMNWLNTPDNTSSYEKALNYNYDSSPSSLQSPSSNLYSSYSENNTPIRTGSLSISKPTPISFKLSNATTPEHNYSYEIKGQFSKESTETISSFDKDLRRKASSSTIGSSVSSIHSYNYKQSLSNASSPSIEGDTIENDINYNVGDELEEDLDDYLTGFDQEQNDIKKNILNDIEDVCVSNVYNGKGRYWYRAEIFFKDGNKRFLRRYYQDFFDLHNQINLLINNTENYIDNEIYLLPKMPGPIPRPDPNNPSKHLLQRCHDLNSYFHNLFLKLNHDGYTNETFEDWIAARFGDYDSNGVDPVSASLDNPILFERPIMDESMEIKQHSSNGLGSPKIAVPKFEYANEYQSEIGSNPYNTNSLLWSNNSPISYRSPSPMNNVINTSPKIRQQVMNKNLPPIPMGDSLVPPTPVSIKRTHNNSPISAMHQKQQFNQLKYSPFNQTDEDDEAVRFHDKSNNDIMEEIESELIMTNVSIIDPLRNKKIGVSSLPNQSMSSSTPTSTNFSGIDGYSDSSNSNNNYTEADLSFTDHQISGPQIRVKVFYNDGEDIFITKVPVSLNLAQLKNKIFVRVKADYDKHNPAIGRTLKTSDDIILFNKDSNGMYSAIKDDLMLRNVIRSSKGKFSVRVELD